jgi:hypothetical protein
MLSGGPQRDTSPEVEAWRKKMVSDEALRAYRGRSSLVENVNGHVKTTYGLTNFVVRGVKKATCVALLTALAHNLLVHGRRLVEALG